MTGDLDILIENVEENARKIINAIKEFGFKDINLEVEDFIEPGYVIQLGYPPNRIDIHTGTALAFDEIFKEKVPVMVDDVNFFVISRKHLIEIKKMSGRPKDLADIECLKRRRS